MSSPLAVRPATADDLDWLAAAEADVFGDDAWSPALIGSGLADTLVDPDRRGWVVLSVAGDIADLQRIAVVGSERRTGLGTALLAEAVLVASRRGADRVLLEVRADNEAALAFYAAARFEEIDRRTGYYRGGTDAVVMLRPLTEGRQGGWTHE